jgi:hypothetical protein
MPGTLSSVLAAFETTIQRNNESTGSDGSFLTLGSRRRRRPLVVGKPVPEPAEGENPSGRTSGKYQRHQSSNVSKPTSSPKYTGSSSTSHRRRENSPGAARSPSTSVRSKLDEVSFGSPTEETDASSGQFEQSPPRSVVRAQLPNSIKHAVPGEALVASAQTVVSPFSPMKTKKKLHSSLPSMSNLPNFEFSTSSLPVSLPKTSSPINNSKKPSPLQSRSPNRSIADTVRHEKLHYPKSPVPQKGVIKALKDFAKDDETLTNDTATTSSDEVSVRSINTFDLNHNAVKPSRADKATVSPPPPPPFQHRSPLSQYEYDYVDPVAFLKCKARPRSILLRRNHEINTQRHVQFLDLQPGGGRRMSIEGQSSKDSLPQRPRRASLTLQCAPSSLDTGQLAATKIQSTFRGYAQWKQTRAHLLEQQLERIEREHRNELIAITERKWNGMDALRNEAVEEEKRLDEQVALANQLIEHLKRDSAMIRDQTKKVKEHCKTLQQSNRHCEKLAQLQSESITAMHQNVEQLQERQDDLRATERKCSIKIQSRTTKLTATSQDVKRQFQGKIRLKHVTGTMLKTLKQRCRDDNLVSLISEFVTSNTKLLDTDLKLDDDTTTSRTVRDGHLSGQLLQKNSPSGFDLCLRPILDDQSVVSDNITKVRTGRSTTKDNRAERSVSRRSPSFAVYDPKQIVSQTMKTITEE